jgi:hypothetical protein
MTGRSDVTVVIPTRNRRDELLASIDSILASDHPELTVAVFDNCSDDGTAEAVRARYGERVLLKRSESALAMTDSFEGAYAMARSAWVIGIGADDGLHPAAVSTFIRLAQRHRVEVVTPSRASYYWPGTLPEEPSGALGVPPIRSDRIVRSRAVVRGVLSGRMKWYLLPAGYFGLVHADVLRRVQRRHGRLFPSLTPDVGLSFAIAREVDRYLVCGQPLFISGASPQSNGRSQFGSGDPSIADEYWNDNRRATIRLHPGLGGIDGRLPASLRAVILEAFLQAGSPDGLIQRGLSDIRVQAVLAYVEDAHPDAIWGALVRSSARPLVRASWPAVHASARVGRIAVRVGRSVRTIRNRVGSELGRTPDLRRMKHAHRESGITSLRAAVERLDRFLQSQGWDPEA